MNIKRGMYRVWIVLSLIFVVIVIAASWQNLHTQYNNAFHPFWKNDILLVPINCDEARGDNKDYRKEDKPWQLNWERTPKVGSLVNLCWYEMSRFRQLYTEYNMLSDEELSQKLYKAVSIHTKNSGYIAKEFWQSLMQTIAFAIGSPFLVLFSGYALSWVLRGFKVSTSSE